jgi:uncharacterized protein YuzB (UPF0349 family)
MTVRPCIPLGILAHLYLRVLEGGKEEAADSLRVKKGGFLRHCTAAAANLFHVFNGNVIGNDCPLMFCESGLQLYV